MTFTFLMRRYKMDPLSAIVTALVTGAAAGIKPTAEKVIKDAYEGIKALVKRRLNAPVVEVLEADPTSETAKTLLGEQLKKAGAAEDEELLKQAKALLELVKQHASQVPEVIGVKLSDVEAASLTLDDIISSGSGVVVDKGKFKEGIKITKVRADGKDPDTNPK